MVRATTGRRLGDIFGDRLLVLGAHPDDSELMVGGLLACWEGNKMVVVVTTMRESNPEKQTVRETEIANAMEVLGVKDYEVGTQPDAFLVHDGRLTRYVEELARKFRPTLVVTHKADDFHQDHRAISQAVLAALRRAPATLLYGESYLWPLPGPNLYVDISGVLHTKLSALGKYVSIIRNKTFDPESVKAFHLVRGAQSFRYGAAECFYLAKSLTERHV